jgi:hypothetical protein
LIKISNFKTLAIRNLDIVLSLVLAICDLPMQGGQLSLGRRFGAGHAQ